MQKTRLRRYARLIARVGAGIQKGQPVNIFCQLDQPTAGEYLGAIQTINRILEQFPVGKS